MISSIIMRESGSASRLSLSQRSAVWKRTWFIPKGSVVQIHPLLPKSCQTLHSELPVIQTFCLGAPASTPCQSFPPRFGARSGIWTP